MSIGPAFARGSKAWGICQRCGLRSYLHSLVPDGYFPWLRVHPECYEAKHPQERLVAVSDPVALWRPAPEDYIQVAPALTGIQNGGDFDLTWTEAKTVGPRIERYVVYRISDADEVTQELASLPVTYSDFMAILSETLVFNDLSVPMGFLYNYTVVALDNYGRGISSNIVSLDLHTAPTIDGAFLFESGDFFVQEDGSYLLLE